MAKMQMQRVSICALKKDRKEILEKVQHLGVMEVKSIEDEELDKMDTVQARQGFDKKSHRAENALEILNEYAPAKGSLFDSLKGKKLIPKNEYEATVSNRDELLKISKSLIELNKEIEEGKAEVAKLENQIEAIIPWIDLDIPMDYEGTKKTSVIIGTMEAEITLEDIYSAVLEVDTNLDALDVNIISKDKDAAYIVIICLKEDKASVEEALRLKGFAKPANKISKVPSELKSDLEARINARGITIEEKKEEIIALADKREELQLISDFYRIRKDKYEVLGVLPQSERTFFLSGYIPVENVKMIEEEVGNKYNCVLDIEDTLPDEDVPVKLKNSKFGACAEGITESYGLPGKEDIDPSSIMAIFYIIFFGLMLSDAAYGFIVFIACFVVLKKFPRMSESMQKSLRLFMYCGISTLVWGLLFGGIFGDLISVFSKTFLSHEVVFKPLWFAPLDEPMKLLTYSMLFGVIHMFVGLGIKGYICLKNKDVIGFISDVVFWYMMLVGLILMLLPSQIFSSISQMEMTFPPIINTLAKALAIIGALGIFVMSGRRSKNIALRLGLGAYDLYNVTGWLSDVLSYSRLLALGLATGVVASVINQMGTMAGKTVPGVLIFIFAFVFGHILNMAINLLGAYVHTCRLQYVEFFGKFYEGGGRAFTPFKTKTNYIEVKED
ncbi:MAG: V-type ATP synthase subunit I [Suipraeoptans sp.]